MRNYKILILLILIISFVLGQNEISPAKLYDNGNQAMLKGEYQTAIENYEQIISEKLNQPDLYYNIGNAYFKNGEIGNAIWAYEKGLQLAPRDKDLRFNLAVVNARVRDRIKAPPIFFVLEQYRALKNSSTLTDIILIAATLLMLAALLYFMKKYYAWQSRWISRLGIGILFVSLVVHIAAIDKYYEISDTDFVIITSQEVDIYSAPFARRDAIHFRLHEGVKAEIAQEQSGWLEIILIDGKKGWISEENIRKL